MMKISADNFDSFGFAGAGQKNETEYKTCNFRTNLKVHSK